MFSEWSAWCDLMACGWIMSSAATKELKLSPKCQPRLIFWLWSCPQQLLDKYILGCGWGSKVGPIKFPIALELMSSWIIQWVCCLNTQVKGKVAGVGAPTVQVGVSGLRFWQVHMFIQGLCLSYAAAANGCANEAPRLSYLFIPLNVANESLFSWCRWVLCSAKASVCTNNNRTPMA